MADRALRLGVLAVVLAGLCVSAAPEARAASAVGEVVGGVGEIVGGAFALPMNVLVGTFTGPPIVGTVKGALMGTVQTLGMTAHGLVRITRGGIPLAAKVLPFLLFL